MCVYVCGGGRVRGHPAGDLSDGARSLTSYASLTSL